MVQAPQTIKKARKANITVFLTLAIAIAMLIGLGMFFRVGLPDEDAPRQLTKKETGMIAGWTSRARQLRGKGRRQEAVVYNRKIIDLLEKEKIDDWLMLASTYVRQSDIFRELGLRDKALPALEKAKEIVKEHHLEEQSLTCEILLREGIFKFENKEFVEADEFFQQALTCSATLTSYLSAETTHNLIWLAQACLTPSINKPEKALQYLRAAEEVCSSSNPERPLMMMTSLKVQGITLMTMKKYSEAEEKLTGAEELAERLFNDPKNPEREQIGQLLKQAQQGKVAQ